VRIHYALLIFEPIFFEPILEPRFGPAVLAKSQSTEYKK